MEMKDKMSKNTNSMQMFKSLHIIVFCPVNKVHFKRKKGAAAVHSGMYKYVKSTSDTY